MIKSIAQSKKDWTEKFKKDAGYSDARPFYSNSDDFQFTDEEMKKVPQKKPVESPAKKFIDFLCPVDEDEWSGMKHLSAPIQSYLHYSAGDMRVNYGCIIPPHIPDDAVIAQSATDLFYFSWRKNNMWCYSSKIEL